MSLVDFLLRRRKLSVSYGALMYVADRFNTVPSAEDFKTYANEVMDQVKKLSRSVE
jgi:replicative DNA helicase